ncbi:MAG: CRTAC1 family protein, partial [Planctomycetota bacterium]|nr:CRTAC1 family protein [Planctomycetota bacterium]
YGCAVGDIDNDGDPDLYVTNFGPNTLYENLGDGTFREVGSKRGVADGGWGHSAAFGDIDSDGDLDLYVTNKIVFDIDRPPNEGRPCLYRGLPGMCGPLGLTPQADRLYRNDGRGAFEDVSESSGIAAPPPSYGLGVIFGDYDDDGRVDIYVANDSLPNFLFHNLGDGKFDEVAGTAGVAVKGDGIPQAGMGVDFGDFDGDLRPDIFVTNFSQDYYTLYWNAGEGLFVDVAAGSALENATRTVLGWGTRFLDVDNDGDQDLYAANGHVYPDIGSLDLGSTYWEPDQLFLNMGGSEFREASERIRLSGPPRCSRGAAFGDIDNDGDIDVVVVEMADRPTLLENVGGNKGNWIRIVLRGHESNRHGMGARVWVTAMEKTQRREATRGGSYCSSSDPRVHVGLGKADRVERIRVIWPSGKEQGFSDLEVNREIVIDEDAGIVRRQEERR